MSDHCKQLVKGDPYGSWSEDCTPKYIRMDQFLEYNRAGHEMTKEEKWLAHSWYDPRYEIVDPSDYAWSDKNTFNQRIGRDYEANIIAQEDYEYMLAEEQLNGESTERCHEIMVKMGLLRRIAQA